MPVYQVSPGGGVEQTPSGIGWSDTLGHRYNTLGHQIETTQYFIPTSFRSIGGGRGVEYVPADTRLANSVKHVQRHIYNGDGQLSVSSTIGFTEGGVSAALAAGPGHRIDKSELVTANGGTASGASNLNVTVQGYDRGGQLDSLRYTQNAHELGEHELAPEESVSPSRFTFDYDYQYDEEDRRQTYLESRVLGSGQVNTVSPGEGGSFAPASTFSSYDANGQRTVIESERLNGGTREVEGYDARYFNHSSDGHLVVKTSGEQDKRHTEALATAGSPPFVAAQTKAQSIGFEVETAKKVNAQAGEEGQEAATTSHYVYSGGQYLGELKETGEIQVKQAHFGGIDTSQSVGSRRHQVQEGETLRGVAIQYYGNADLWYVIADANGLSSVEVDSPLVAGQSLEIPQQAINQNRFDTFTAGAIAQEILDKEAEEEILH